MSCKCSAKIAMDFLSNFANATVMISKLFFCAVKFNQEHLSWYAISQISPLFFSIKTEMFRQDQKFWSQLLLSKSYFNLLLFTLHFLFLLFIFSLEKFLKRTPTLLECRTLYIPVRMPNLDCFHKINIRFNFLLLVIILKKGQNIRNYIPAIFQVSSTYNLFHLYGFWRPKASILKEHVCPAKY